MRKIKFLIAGIIAFFMFSCIDDLDLPPSSEMQQTTTFGISDAMRYFEENADDLSFIHFKDSILTTRSTIWKQTELTPDWDNAVHSANRVAELVEIPILSNAVMFSDIR